MMARAGRASAANTIVYYVSTAGSDSWTGKSAEPTNPKGIPSGAKADGPFATVSKARKAIRKLKDGKGLKFPVSVEIRGGIYYQEKTLVFSSEDSGSKDFPITYQAYKNEKPVLSGGRKISNWKKSSIQHPGSSIQLWEAEIPEVKTGDWDFNQLFVNGERRTRARTPDKGNYFYTRSPLASPKSSLGFFYKKGDIKEWDNLDDAIIVLFHMWESSIHYIDSLDTENFIAEFKSPSPWPVGGWANWERNHRYYIENIFEALDSPGEWYLNKKTGVLYYYPVPGEDMAKAEVIAPVLNQTIVFLKGNPKEKEYIDFLNFKGITFRHANARLPKRLKNSGQASFPQEAAIMARGLRNSRFEDCEIAHAGEHGIWLASGCEDNLITRCHIHDLGAGGVRIGGGWGIEENPPAQRNTIDNNIINDGCLMFHGAVAVLIARSSYNSVTHNEICDFDYTGISVGWSWGYDPSSAHHNIVEYNHIHHCGHRVMSDMGGIYTLGVSPGTKLRYNLIHDIYAYGNGAQGTGIYTDEGSSDILIENNVIYRTKTAGFLQHYGRENTVTNNIFALSEHNGLPEPGEFYRIREESHVSFNIRNNILYNEHGDMLGGNWNNGQYTLDKNLYWSPSGNARFAGKGLEQWQEEGQDRDSIVADPMFVDAKNYDFRLKPGSPAGKVGFKPFDISAAGVYGEKEWVNLPKKLVRHADDPIPPVPEAAAQFVDEDFESTPNGEGPLDCTVYEEKNGKIRVTSETAAGGRKCLKFTDGPGMVNKFNPHMYYNPNLKTGKMAFSIDIMNSKAFPADFYLEFRDWRVNPYRVGPTFAMTPDGIFKAGGKQVAEIPPGEWFSLKVNFELGDGGAKEYTMTLAVPGEKPLILEIPYGSNEFSMLTWMGISSMADGKTVFYVDNIRLAPVK